MIMKRIFYLIAIGIGLFQHLAAQTWLPQVSDEHPTFRLLECHYDKARLVSCQEAGMDWEVRTETSTAPDNGRIGYTFTFTARRDLEQAGVAVAFDRYDWTSDNYVMIPAAVYNGNRQRIVNRQYATGLDATALCERLPASISVERAS